MEVKIRRLENNMITLGTGIIAFSIWALLKYALTSFSDLSPTETMTAEARVVFYIIIIVFSLTDVLLHFYIGVSARSEGKGKKKTPLYLVLSALIIMVYLLGIAFEIYLLFFSKNYFTLFVTALVDVTSTIIFIEMFVYAVQLRGIRRQKRKKEAAV
jgi:small-conductance mechanosensitive channel